MKRRFFILCALLALVNGTTALADSTWHMET